MPRRVRNPAKREGRRTQGGQAGGAAGVCYALAMSALVLRIFSGPRPEAGAPLVADNTQLATMPLAPAGPGAWLGRDDCADATGTATFGRVARGDEFLRDLTSEELNLHVNHWGKRTRTDVICTANEVTVQLATCW